MNIFLALLPVILLLTYIYKKDRFEKEPPRLLATAFILGALSTLVIIALLAPFDSAPWANGLVNALYGATLISAIPEELIKFGVLYALIWRRREFNELFDGIVYAVFISLGFACVENIFYVVEGGVEIAMTRALFSVPGHFLFAVIMGYFFARAKFFGPARKELLRGLEGAMLAHATFNFLLLSQSWFTEVNEGVAVALFILFIVFDILLWRAGLRKIRSLAAKRICGGCGKMWRSGEIFCTSCGARL